MATLAIYQDQARLEYNVEQVKKLDETLATLEDLAFKYKELGFDTGSFEKEFHRLSCAIDELNEENRLILGNPSFRSLYHDLYTDRYDD